MSQATHKILAKSPSYTRVNEDPYIFDQILLPTANQNYRIGLGGGVYLWFCQGSTMGIYIVKNSSIPTSVGHLQHFFLKKCYKCLSNVPCREGEGKMEDLGIDWIITF